MTRRALFWTYNPALPSFRHRLAPLARELERRGWSTVVERFPKGRYLRRILARRASLKSADRLVIAKINLAPGERTLLSRIAPRTFFDFDDAIWLRKPRHAGEPPGRSGFRERKFDASCRAADLVLAGNDYLAARARRGNPNVAVVPTGVNLAAYESAGSFPDDGRSLVWIGMPENLVYLEIVRPALARLAGLHPELRLRVISSAAPDWPELAIELVPWSESVEISALSSSSIGIMPLSQDDWSRGKCAFKLLQYMAAALPSVASPVGEVAEVVVPGENGLLAATDTEWQAAIERLLASPEERRRLGRAGRESLRARYDEARAAALAADLVEGARDPAAAPSR